MIEGIKDDQNKAEAYQEKVVSSLLDSNPQLYHFHYTYTANGLRVTKKT
jgi:hypothetical protein